MYHPFSVSSTLKTSWTVLKKNFITLIIYSIISLLVSGLINILTLIVFIDDSMISRFILIFLQLIIQSYLALSFYKLILTLMDKEYYEFDFKEILPSIKMTFNFIAIGIAYGVLVVIVLLINFPLRESAGILKIVQVIETALLLYLLIRSIFCVCFIVDEDSGPVESLRQSFQNTRDNFFNTFFIVLIILGIMVITLVPIVSVLSLFNPNKSNIDFLFKLSFYLWFVIAFPAVQVIIMVTYRKLVYSHQDIDDDPVETN